MQEQTEPCELFASAVILSLSSSKNSAAVNSHITRSDAGNTNRRPKRGCGTGNGMEIHIRFQPFLSSLPPFRALLAVRRADADGNKYISSPHTALVMLCRQRERRNRW